jgi:hypothetical protein
MRIRILLLIKVTEIILRLQASTVSVRSSPGLSFEPLKLLNFDFNADPDTAWKYNADPYGSGSSTPDEHLLRLHLCGDPKTTAIEKRRFS